MTPSRGTKYRQVADRIRGAIQSGELGEGQALPTENQLAARYRVSRPTVRAALALLRSEGLVDAQQGRGAFVRLRPAVRRMPLPQLPLEAEAPLPPLSTDAGREHRITEAGPTAVWGEVASLLGVSNGEQAFVRRRLVTNGDGLPVELSSHFFPFVRKPAGRRSDRTASLISARMPTPAETTALRVADGVPLLAMLVASYDVDGDPIQVLETLWPADRYAIYDEYPSGTAVATEPHERASDEENV